MCTLFLPGRVALDTNKTKPNVNQLGDTLGKLHLTMFFKCSSSFMKTFTEIKLHDKFKEETS